MKKSVISLVKIIFACMLLFNVISNMAFADVIDPQINKENNYRTNEDFFYYKGELSHGLRTDDWRWLGISLFIVQLTMVLILIYNVTRLVLKKKDEEIKDAKYYAKLVSGFIVPLVVLVGISIFINYTEVPLDGVWNLWTLNTLLASVFMVSLIILLYKTITLIKALIKNEEIINANLIVVFSIVVVYVLLICGNLILRARNSYYLYQDLAPAKNRLSSNSYFELKEDIKSITLKGVPKYATVKNHKKENSREESGDTDYLVKVITEDYYEPATMDGSGYEIKSDGTVIFSKSKEFITKIAIPPEKFDFVYWYTHGFID